MFGGTRVPLTDPPARRALRSSSYLRSDHLKVSLVVVPHRISHMWYPQNASSAMAITCEHGAVDSRHAWAVSSGHLLAFPPHSWIS
eukprot:scaffold268311_cov40-Tisochrysis_lutea.AAC.2